MVGGGSQGRVRCDGDSGATARGRGGYMACIWGSWAPGAGMLMVPVSSQEQESDLAEPYATFHVHTIAGKAAYLPYAFRSTFAPAAAQACG